MVMLALHISFVGRHGGLAETSCDVGSCGVETCACSQWSTSHSSARWPMVDAGGILYTYASRHWKVVSSACGPSSSAHGNTQHECRSPPCSDSGQSTAA